MKRADLRGAVALSHLYLRERVRPGDRVLDATCGQGRDTLLLAQLVGAEGRVWAFDVQEEALRNTALLLEEAGVRGRVELVAAGHERLAEYVNEPLRAAVFNLGYLPGGDKSCITRPENTLVALGQATTLLQPGGIIVIVLYTGHAGGGDESGKVEEWSAGLSPEGFNVWQSRQPNRPPTAPYLVLIEKTA